jgi:hypothetical protein
LNGVHADPLGHGSVVAAQIVCSPSAQLVAQWAPVKPVPRSKPHVGSGATVPAPQHTEPAAFPTQSTGPLQFHASEPATGQAAPSAWHVEPLATVLGVSQHSWADAQWMAPTVVKGQ